MVAAADAPVAVGRDEGDGVGDRAREGVGDDVRRQLGQPPEPALLPRGHDCGHGRLVCHGRTGGGEREPTARALATAPHRPRRRRAAALAVDAEQERERSPAVRAEILTQTGAGNAATRQEKVEKHIASTLAGKSARVVHGSVPKALLLERVLGSARQPLLLPHPVVGIE